jgi:transglutaminase-like putative cysteine protease
MLRIAASIIVASMPAAATAYAGNDQVRRGAVPDWVVPSELRPVPAGASGLLFVRRYDTLVHLDDQGQAQYLGYRIKILHSNALDLGNLSISWDPSAGAPMAHVIRVHRGSDAIDVLGNASFEILRREDQLEAASLDGILTAVLRVPDLRVGDELEVGLTTPMSDPTLKPKDTGLLMLSPDPGPGRFRIGLSWKDGHKPHLKMNSGMTAAAREGPRGVTFDFDDPATLVLPQGAPPRYTWQRVVEYSDFSDWTAISRHFAPLYARAAALAAGSPLKAEARRIAAAHATPLDRARAALKLVQQEVRYVYVGLDGGNLTPAAAAETWQRRYGDCKGKTALLLGLLAELGVEADPVLVSNSGIDDGMDERLPSPRLFDHVLVRARIGGSKYWLDGTLPPVAEPSLDPVMPYRWSLPITAQGTSLEGLSWSPARTPEEITMYEIDARAGFDQPAKITTTTISRGLAGLQQHVQLSGAAPGQLLSGLRQQMSAPWQTMEDAQWRYDQKAQAGVLTITGTGTVGWEDEGNGSKWLALAGGGAIPPERRLRAAGQDQEAPYYDPPRYRCWVTTVRLPQATKPEHWSFNTAYDARIFGMNYQRAFELRDGAIRMVRAVRHEQQEIDAAAARRDNARIAAFDNSMAVITYDPAGGTPAPTVGRRVPATYEIDWTADTVPCLSSGAAD